jgi:hypothetical protein
MCNAFFRFRLWRESIVDRGLTRCSSKMQQRISGNLLVVRCRGAGGVMAGRFRSRERMG